MWYVLQVQTGSERKTSDLIQRMADSATYKRIVIPTRQIPWRKDGAWTTKTELLFPGYLFVVTHKPLDFLQELRGVPALTILLGADVNNDRIAALSSGEEKLLAMLLNDRDCLTSSIIAKEGDQIQILGGPLVGQEALIRKIDRHKRVAYVEMSICGRTSLVKLGLEFVE